LRAKLTATGQTGTQDLVPNDIRHWDNLVGVHQSSPTLPDFISNELTADRRRAVDEVSAGAAIGMADASARGAFTLPFFFVQHALPRLRDKYL